MYLRHTTLRKDGKVHRYWRLVRSVRVGRKVVQQTVAHLGELDPEGRARAKALARAITGDREQSDLFEAGVAEEAIPVRLKRIAQGEPLRVAHREPLRVRDRVPRIEVQFLGCVVISDLGVKSARA